MVTHLLVVDLKHPENGVLLSAFHGGYHGPELHHPNGSATAEVKLGGRGAKGFQGSGVAEMQRDLDIQMFERERKGWGKEGGKKNNTQKQPQVRLLTLPHL